MKNKLETGFALLVIVSVGVMMVWQQYPEQVQDEYNLIENRRVAGGFLLMTFAVIYFAWSNWRTVRALDESIRQRSEQALALKRERDFASSLVNTMPVSILLLDAQGVINYINPCFEKLTGFQLEEIRGKDWFTSFLPERDRERIRALFHSVCGDRTIRSNVNPIIIRNGEEREIEWNSQAIHDLHGKMTGVISIGRDVTEQHQREQEIQRLAAIVRYSSDFIGIFSLNGGVQFLNNAGRHLVGINDDEHLSDAKLAGYFAEVERQYRVPEILSAVEATGRWVNEANLYHFQSGASIAVMLDMFRIDDPITGQPINYGMVASDLRAQKSQRRTAALKRTSPQRSATHCQSGQLGTGFAKR